MATMITSEDDAKERVCMMMSASTRPGPSNLRRCIGSMCFTYWRWKNEEQTLGYCNVKGEPEF